MKKLITIISITFLTSCTPNESPYDRCKMVTDKDVTFESVGVNKYAPVYYLYLDGTKTKVSKDVFEKYNVGSEKCLDY